MQYTETLEYFTDNNIFEITGEYEVVVDNNYGADADGNRGEHREWIELCNSLLRIVKQGTDNDLINLIPPLMMRNLTAWFEDHCDPAKVQEAEMDEQADLEYDRRREEMK